MAINLCDRCDESRKFMSDNCWPQPCYKKSRGLTAYDISRICYKTKKMLISQHLLLSKFSWELTDSNRRPSACKADALNQLS